MKLSEEQQAFIVRWLARYKTPSDVVALVKEEFGLEIDRQAVRHYNPEQCEPAQKWRRLFDLERQAFKTAALSQAIAIQSVRLQEYWSLYLLAKKRGNVGQAAAILRQAAEEVGGIYTNTRKVQYTPDELYREAASALGIDPDRLSPEALLGLGEAMATGTDPGKTN